MEYQKSIADGNADFLPAFHMQQPTSIALIQRSIALEPTASPAQTLWASIIYHTGLRSYSLRTFAGHRLECACSATHQLHHHHSATFLHGENVTDFSHHRPRIDAADLGRTLSLLCSLKIPPPKHCGHWCSSWLRFRSALCLPIVHL